MSTRSGRDGFLVVVLLLGAVAACSSSPSSHQSAPAVSNAQPTQPTGADEALKETLATQLAARSVKVTAADLRLDWFSGELPPGTRLFRAVYGQGDERRFVTGIVEGGGAAETRTNDAVGRLISLWHDAGTQGAVGPARAIAFLMAPEDHDIVLETDADIAAATVPSHLQGKVAVPTTVEIDGQPGYQFWWVRRGQVSQVTVHLGADGRAITEQKLGPDFLGNG